MRIFARLIITLSAVAMCGCMDYGAPQTEHFEMRGEGLFVVCEGNFMYGNASLSYIDFDTQTVHNEVFSRANGAKLGDVAQSMTMHGGRGYVVVNNSGVIYVVDPATFEVEGVINGLVSPRYIHFVSDTKAYVTDLYNPQITVINPSTYKITGYISTGDHPSTEQMVQVGDYVFANCWSYDNRILAIDTRTDSVVESIEVGMQPTSLVADCNDKIWTITDGGYEGSPYGNEPPSLYRIDAATRRVEWQYEFDSDDHPSEICINGSGDKIYFLNGSVWAMSVTATDLPKEPLIVGSASTLYYGLAVDPTTEEVYVADAVDYVQSGVVSRYLSDGTFVAKYRVGITPGAFCFKHNE